MADGERRHLVEISNRKREKSYWHELQVLERHHAQPCSCMQRYHTRILSWFYASISMYERKTQNRGSPQRDAVPPRISIRDSLVCTLQEPSQANTLIDPISTRCLFTDSHSMCNHRMSGIASRMTQYQMDLTSKSKEKGDTGELSDGSIVMMAYLWQKDPSSSLLSR